MTPFLSKGIVIIGAGPMQQHLILAAKEGGFKIFLVDQNEQAVAMPLADVKIIESTKNYSEVIQKLSPYCGQFSLCATIATDMSKTVAMVNEAFDLDGINLSIAEVTTHKGKMRDFLQTLEIAQPQYCYANEKEPLKKFIDEQKKIDVKKSFVIKPVNNMGARGVMKIQDSDDISYAFEFSSRYSEDDMVIVEEYIEAREISVDVLVFNGTPYFCGIADRMIEISHEHFFIETGHSMPSRDHTALEQIMLPVFEKVCDGLNKLCADGERFFGALKADIRYTEGKVYIGEIAARLSGGYMSSHTYPLASGNNLAQGYLQVLQKELPAFLAQKKNNVYRRVCLERALINKAGKITAFTLDKALTASANFDFYPLGDKHIFLHKGHGDVIYDLQNNIGKTANVIVVAEEEAKAQQEIDKIFSLIDIQTSDDGFDQKSIDLQARKNFSKDICWVCKICDGANCASSVPGMGGVGFMNTFNANFDRLQDIQLRAVYLRREDEPEEDEDFHFQFFSHRLKFPILSAPITGSQTNFGNAISEFDYAFETSFAMQRLGLLPTFGDGASPDKYLVGLKAIASFQAGLPVFKPRADLDELLLRIEKAKALGAKAWGIDIDGVSFKTMRLKNQKTKFKTVDDLRYLKERGGLDFFVKGAMSIDDAQMAIEAGCSAIIVSNHGGRVVDSLPATCDVLPAISDYVRKCYPTTPVLVDGGIRSGVDIFKMLALGANAVLIGRPIVIAAVAYGRSGVISLLSRYIEEFTQTTRALGVKKLSQIDQRFLASSYK